MVLLPRPSAHSGLLHLIIRHLSGLPQVSQKSLTPHPWRGHVLLLDASISALFLLRSLIKTTITPLIGLLDAVSIAATQLDCKLLGGKLNLYL